MSYFSQLQPLLQNVLSIFKNLFNLYSKLETVGGFENTHSINTVSIHCFLIRRPRDVRTLHIYIKFTFRGLKRVYLNFIGRDQLRKCKTLILDINIKVAIV